MQQWSLAAMPGTSCVLVSGCGTSSLPWGPWGWPESYSTDPLKGQSQQKTTDHQGSQLPAEPEQGLVWSLGSLSSFICTTRGESPAVWGCSPSLPSSRAEEPTTAAKAPQQLQQRHGASLMDSVWLWPLLVIYQHQGISSFSTFADHKCSMGSKTMRFNSVMLLLLCKQWGFCPYRSLSEWLGLCRVAVAAGRKDALLLNHVWNPHTMRYWIGSEQTALANTIAGRPCGAKVVVVLVRVHGGAGSLAFHSCSNHNFLQVVHLQHLYKKSPWESWWQWAGLFCILIWHISV